MQLLAGIRHVVVGDISRSRESDVWFGDRPAVVGSAPDPSNRLLQEAKIDVHPDGVGEPRLVLPEEVTRTPDLQVPERDLVSAPELRVTLEEPDSLFRRPRSFRRGR